MKKRLYPYLLLLGALLFSACGGDDNNNDPQQPTIDPVEQLTEQGAQSFMLQGLVDPVKGYNSLKPSGYSDALYLE